MQDRVKEIYNMLNFNQRSKIIQKP